MAIKLSSEMKFFLVFAGILVVWFNYGYFQLQGWITQNFFVAYMVLTGIYVFLAMKLILDVNPLADIRKFAAFFLVSFAFDIIAFPYLVTPMELATDNIYANISSDVFIYRLLGQTGIIGYNLTFVVAPIAMLYVARRLISKGTFTNYVKQSV